MTETQLIQKMFLVLMPTSPKHNTTNTNLNFLWDFGNKERVGGVYEYSFNTQMHTDEISGTGNHTTALFWEYDTRLGRRWNLDPKPQVFISDYAVFGNSPIYNVDFKGDYFFGLFGSTSKQRQAAENFAKKYNGTIMNKHRKNISVVYSEKVKNNAHETTLVILHQQFFDKNGELLPENGEIKEKQLSVWDKMSESKNPFIKISYNLIDEAFVAIQATPFVAPFIDPDERRHLTGEAASQFEVEEAFISTLTYALGPLSKLSGVKTLKRLNTAQFSKKFKGNLAKLPAMLRGKLNKLYNKGVD